MKFNVFRAGQKLIEPVIGVGIVKLCHGTEPLY